MESSVSKSLKLQNGSLFRMGIFLLSPIDYVFLFYFCIYMYLNSIIYTLCCCFMGGIWKFFSLLCE